MISVELEVGFVKKKIIIINGDILTVYFYDNPNKIVLFYKSIFSTVFYPKFQVKWNKGKQKF